jgi:hypothetical protein
VALTGRFSGAYESEVGIAVKCGHSQENQYPGT